MTLAVDDNLVTGHTAPALKGRYAFSSALEQMLQGSGLSMRLEGGVWLIVRAPATDALELSATSINAVVSAQPTEGTGSYTARAVTLGKGVASLRQTPQSVSVVTRQQMDDRNLTSLDQVLYQAPGITLQTRNFGDHQFNARGFELGADAYLVDGMPGVIHSPTGWMTPDTAVYDRVEILRGAAGLLVGNGNPGGAINLVRKRPTALPQYSVTSRAGSDDYYRMDLDASGALNDARTLRGRALVAYEDRQYFYDQASSRMPLFYGIAEADLNDRTLLTVGLRHQRSVTNGYAIFGLPRYSTGKALDASRSTSLAQDWNRHESDQTEVFAELEYQLNDDWKSKTSLTRSEGGFDQRVALPRGAINPQTQRGSVLYSNLFRRDEVVDTGIDTNLSGTFQAFGLEHSLMVGGNWSDEDLHSKNANLANGTPIDVFNPDHHASAKPVRTGWDTIDDSTARRYGLYTNARIRLSEPLSLVLGGRLSWYEYQTREQFSGDKAANRQDHQFTPFVGVIYDFSEQWSWYASYADIFQPQSQYRTASGTLLDPAVGTHHETGLKGELYDGRLNLSAAVFYIKQNDVAVEDPDQNAFCPSNVGGVCYLGNQVKRSKGYELQASGELLPGWQVSAGYTFNITRNATGGPTDYQTPRHLLRASTTYNLPGDWHRLTLGGGVSAQSGYTTDDFGPEVGNPGRAVYDALASWKIDNHWKVGVDVKNVFDKDYYKSVGELRRGSYYGDPRSYMLTLRGDF
ncbi:TonB-dependent siderophore receptor [Pseudomonas brassicae]|uniref:TonB-dependent siderophore receptor n=1 Tax=Pseudomonas brassicae TaxID=2708063 RepID=UPI0030830FE0